MAVTDNFNRSDGAGLGSNWTAILNNLNISSNTAVANAGATNCMAYWNADAFGNDQYAAATFPGNIGIFSNTPGLVLRASASSCYMARVLNTGNVEIYRWASPTFTLLGSAFTGTGFVVGDRLRFEAIGTTLSVYRNGTLIGSRTDANIASGSAGVYSQSQTARVDDFEADTIAGGANVPSKQYSYRRRRAA